MLNYYLLDFFYKGPFSNSGVGGGASRALVTAEKAVVKTLARGGFDFRHAYSWPDGSLYFYLRTDLSGKEVEGQLEAAFPIESNVHVAKVHDALATENPHKHPCATLEDYFSMPGRGY